MWLFFYRCPGWLGQKCRRDREDCERRGTRGDIDGDERGEFRWSEAMERCRDEYKGILADSGRVNDKPVELKEERPSVRITLEIQNNSCTGFFFLLEGSEGRGRETKNKIICKAELHVRVISCSDKHRGGAYLLVTAAPPISSVGQVR